MDNKYHKYSIEIIRNIEDLESLKSTWDELTKHNHNVYLTYEWVSFWLKCFLDKSSSIFIIIVKNGNQPIAIAPLLIKRGNISLIPYQKIEFISMADYPDSPTNLCAELDFIIPQANKEIIDLIIQELMKEKWNFIRLHPIPSESNTLIELKNSAKKNNLIFFEREAFQSLIINTAMKWDELKNLLSKGFKKSLRYFQNKIKELGDVDFILLKSKEEISDNLKHVFDIEQRSWKWNKGISINSVKYNNFFQEFPLYVSHLGWIHLWFLKLNDKYIAYDLGIFYKNRLICLKGSFDQKYADYGPGQLLLSKEIEYYTNNGITEYNMLWGDTIAKERWRPFKKSYTEVFIFKKNIYSIILKVLLLDLKFYLIYRIIEDYRKRLLRKLKIRTRNSELTRMDQIEK